MEKPSEKLVKLVEWAVFSRSDSGIAQEDEESGGASRRQRWGSLLQDEEHAQKEGKHLHKVSPAPPRRTPHMPAELAAVIAISFLLA